MTALYRAVLPAELASILATGTFSNIAGIETKYFSTNLQGARSYAAQAARIFGDGPFTIVQTTMLANLITADMQVTVDGGIETVTVPTSLLGRLSSTRIVPREVVMRNAPDALVSVRLLPSDQGGRQGPTPDRMFGCIMVIDGVNVDVRCRLGRQGPLQPGTTRDVEVDFLNPDFARPHLRVGEEFQLREASIIGSGVVKQILMRQAQRHHA